jgi:hypothetical protein
MDLVKASIELFIGMILIFQGLSYVLKCVYIGDQLYSGPLHSNANECIG